MTTANRGRAPIVAMFAVTAAFACVAKIYPEADPETEAGREVSRVELDTGAGELSSSVDAGSAQASLDSSDADEGTLGTAAGCQPVALYRDRDGDGFGSGAPEDVIQGCPPLEGFVSDNTDCHDAEHTGRDPAGDVFPGQTEFFTVGYPTANGISFDYDCSEHEEANPSNDFVPAPANCEERRPPCGVDLGYVVPGDARSGEGVDPLCGVRQRAWCRAASPDACGLEFLPATDPFPCR